MSQMMQRIATQGPLLHRFYPLHHRHVGASRLARMPTRQGILAPAAATNGAISSVEPMPLGSDLPSNYADPFDRPSKGRRSGVILHPTSLPGEYGIGELGQQALQFINWLEEAGCGIWQVLPLVPPDKYGSPYSSTGTHFS